MLDRYIDTTYWYDRKIADDEAYDKMERKGLEEVKKLYQSTIDDINTELGKFYLDYSLDNKMSLQDAQRLLTGKELQKLKENIGKWEAEYKESKITDKEYFSKLNALKKRTKIQRLEALKLNLESKVFNLYSGYNSKTTNLLFDVYALAHKNTVYNLTKLVGENATQKFGVKFFNAPNDKLISDIINTPWSGANYSELMWNNRTQVAEAVKKNVTQGLIRGRHYKETAKVLEKELNTDYYKAKRLIRTESKYAISRSEQNTYTDAGIEYYEYCAVMDKRTSWICLKLDGKRDKMSEGIPGVNMPPMHPFCRSFIIPIIEFDDEVENIN